MAGIEVIAGDFPTGRAELGFGMLVFPKKPKQGFDKALIVKPEEEIAEVSFASAEEESRVGKAASAGVAGGLLLGPIGLLLGGLLGAANKQKKSVTFTCSLVDGRRLMGKTDPSTYEKLSAFAFKNKAR